jgi:hypothetical protein
MGELYCTHAREEVPRAQPERTKRRDNSGVERSLYITKKVILYYILSIYLII